MQHSFWTGPAKSRHPALRGRVQADVVVAGGGFTGLSCALLLSRAGLKVALLEAKTLGFGASAKCAGVATLSTHTFFCQLEKHFGTQTALSYAHTMQSAFKTVSQLARDQGCGWEDASVHLISERADETLQSEAEAMTRAGLCTRTKREKNGFVLEVQHMGLLDPARYLHCLEQEALKAGACIFEDSRVVGFETNEAHTQQGSVQAPYIIVATGYPVINVPGWYFLKLQQRRGMLMPLYGSCELNGAWFEAEGAYGIRPTAGGALAQSWRQLTDKPEAHDDIREEKMRITARTGMTADQQHEMGLECFTPDDLPYIGPYGRKTPNLFVAAGYGGKGILGSMTAAQAISAKILGLPSQGYDIYSGQRRINGINIPVRIGVQYIHGIIHHPYAPRCPHMGCRLVHNPYTRLWECPCHGSRFDDIGHVLNAPAVQDAMLMERRQKN